DPDPEPLERGILCLFVEVAVVDLLRDDREAETPVCLVECPIVGPPSRRARVHLDELAPREHPREVRRLPADRSRHPTLAAVHRASLSGPPRVAFSQWRTPRPRVTSLGRRTTLSKR